MALCAGIALEGAVDISQCRLQNELMFTHTKAHLPADMYAKCLINQNVIFGYYFELKFQRKFEHSSLLGCYSCRWVNDLGRS